MAKKKVGPGKKVCPKCQEIIGARKMTCECGHEFVAKTKKPIGKSKDSLREQINAVRTMGGLKALKTALAEYEKVAKPIIDLGGYDVAKDILAELEGVKTL